MDAQEGFEQDILHRIEKVGEDENVDWQKKMFCVIRQHEAKEESVTVSKSNKTLIEG